MSDYSNNVNLIVPFGTQIVLLKEIKILNENQFHPKGTVGAISGLPSDAFHAYKIKFPDNSEGMANRKDFSIKKHFQNEQSGLISQLENFELYDFVIYKCVVGSRAFGLETENSDTDLRGIYLPPADIHWSMFGVPEQLENDETQECYWELQKFLILALKANPNILECLFTPLVEYANEIADELLAMRSIFLSKLVYQTYNGYVMSQFKKLEQDLRVSGEVKWKHAMHLILALKANPNILECLFTPLVEYANEIADELLTMRSIFLSKLVYQTYNGYVMSQFKKLEQDLRVSGEVKWKHAMHLIRLLLQGIGILREETLIVRVEENREKLLSIKRGEIDWLEVNELRLKLHKEFEKAFAETNLPERPNYEKANKFLIKSRKIMVIND